MNQTIAYITDIHVDEAYIADIGVNARANWQRILDDVRNRGIRSIIFGGDIGEATAQPFFFDSLKAYQLQLTLGNHDTFAEVSRHFYNEAWKEKGEAYSAQEEAHYKYLFLDTSSNSLSPAQKQWLEKELVSAKPLLLFVHHPVLGVDTPVDKAYPLQGREWLQQRLLARTAPTYIFCGHYHMLDEQHISAIHQFITPAASYQIVKEAQEITADNTGFGYRIITINNDQVSSQVISFSNEAG
jgi:3',5'-cyclic AMP phosphodiesterase CpdA